LIKEKRQGEKRMPFETSGVGYSSNKKGNRWKETSQSKREREKRRRRSESDNPA